MELVDEIQVANTLGEGVVWDARRQCCWWTDIQECALYRYDLDSRQLQQWATPERLCSFALVEGEDYLMAAFESGFAEFDPASGRVDWVQRTAQAAPGTRLNDGRADRQGRFWAGGLVEDDGKAPDGAWLYCLDHHGECTTTLGGIRISNSLCWSPDSRFMYHTDTPSGRIDRYTFDAETGRAGDRDTFVTTEKNCWPDGSTVDADGMLWNAQWGGSQVVRYAPDGRVDQVLAVPVSQPTCVAFGGAELNMLLVTSARQDLDEQALAASPRAGNLFVYETAHRGLPESLYRQR